MKAIVVGCGISGIVSAILLKEKGYVAFVCLVNHFKALMLLSFWLIMFGIS